MNGIMLYKEVKDLGTLKLENYVAQEKRDGEFIRAVKSKGKVVLTNRRLRVKNTYYPEVVKALEELDIDEFEVDGEMTLNAEDDDFNVFQKRALTQNPIKQKELAQEIPVKYFVFDVIGIKGKDLRFKPFEDRAKHLSNFLGANLGFLPTYEVETIRDIVKTKNGEGIMIKLKKGIYEEKRSSINVKHKFFEETEIRVISFDKNNAGLICKDAEDNVVQVSGKQSVEVELAIADKGYCDINIQYLSKTKNNRFRHPSCREVIG